MIDAQNHLQDALNTCNHLVQMDLARILVSYPEVMAKASHAIDYRGENTRRANIGFSECRNRRTRWMKS